MRGVSKTLVVVPLLLPHHKRTRWPCCLLVEFHLLANFRDRKERRRRGRWWVLLYREGEKTWSTTKEDHRVRLCTICGEHKNWKRRDVEKTNYYAHCCVVLFGLSVSDGKNRLIELKMLMMGACLSTRECHSRLVKSVLIIYSFVFSLFEVYDLENFLFPSRY